MALPGGKADGELEATESWATQVTGPLRLIQPLPQLEGSLLEGDQVGQWGTAGHSPHCHQLPGAILPGRHLRPVPVTLPGQAHRTKLNSRVVAVGAEKSSEHGVFPPNAIVANW